MSNCIICNKLINSSHVVNFNEKYSAHLECWTDKIPDANMGIVDKEERKRQRSLEIEKIAKNLILEYERRLSLNTCDNIYESIIRGLKEAIQED